MEKKRILIVPYPSTRRKKPRNKQLPFLIVHELNKINPKWEDGSGIIVRKYTLKKNTRNISKQYDSLAISDKEKIKGRDVLVFDDVITSGSSIRAGIKLIKTANPKKVQGLAIAHKISLEEIPISGII